MTVRPEIACNKIGSTVVALTLCNLTHTVVGERGVDDAKGQGLIFILNTFSQFKDFHAYIFIRAVLAEREAIDGTHRLTANLLDR